MFFSVMIFGHTQADMGPVNKQVLEHFKILKEDPNFALKKWMVKNAMSIGLFAGSTLIGFTLRY